MSAIYVVISLLHVSSGISGGVATIASASWHRRFGSAINHLRSAVFGVSLILPLLLRFGADLRGMRTFAYTRLCSDSGASKGGRRTLTQRMSRRVRLHCQDIIQTRLSLAAVGALRRVGHATSGVHKKVFGRASLLSSAKSSSSLPFSLNTSRPHPTPCCLLPLCPHLSFLSWRSRLLK